MRDALTSPADPIFYVHHSWVDKLWCDWQKSDPETRLYAISGPNYQSPEVGFPEYPGVMDEEDATIFGSPGEEIRRLQQLGKNGDPGNETTLEHILTTLGVIPDATINDVMDTRGGYLCYEYV